MSFGPFQILIILLVILVLFGRGRISETMADFGKGIKSFRQGLKEDESTARIEGPAAEVATAAEPQPADKPH
jgi:sec-independent protein translocase protein TatA